MADGKPPTVTILQNPSTTAVVLPVIGKVTDQLYRGEFCNTVNSLVMLPGDKEGSQPLKEVNRAAEIKVARKLMKLAKKGYKGASAAAMMKAEYGVTGSKIACELMGFDMGLGIQLKM